MAQYKDIEKRKAYMREYMKKRRAENPEKHNKYVRDYYRKMRKEQPELMAEKLRVWKEKNAEHVKAYNRQYAEKNKENIIISRKKRAKIAANNDKETRKKWLESRPNYLRDYNKKYTKKRYHNDIEFRLKMLERTRIRQGLRGKRKPEATVKLLGCTFGELKIYIESLFKDGMSWDNIGEWHIDHIIPLASFDLSNEENQKKAFHYSNQQPLWKNENLKKGAKLLIGVKNG